MDTRKGKVRLGSLLLAASLSFAIAAAFCADQPSRSPVTAPKIRAINQVTSDGITKINLLSDGSNLYITESHAAAEEVAKVSLQSSDRSLVPTEFSSVEALDISADHKTLLVAAVPANAHESRLWTLPVGAGKPRPLGQLSGRDASWSRDGQLLTYAKGSSLYVAQGDGSAAHELWLAKGAVFAPRISPDGKRIRFTVGNASAGTTQLWEINIDGTGEHRLLGDWQDASAACCGNWTADGRYYIFQLTQTSMVALTTLWALPDSGSADSATPIQLTDGPRSFGNAWPSPDNESIWAIGVQPVGEVVRYNPRIGFIPLLDGVSATDLDFSPDGRWIAYISIPDRELWRCRADGSEKLKLISGSGKAALPRWSPDGTEIAYVSIQPDLSSKLAVVPAAGGASQDIFPENHDQMDANWSADGSRIMFGSFNRDKDINIRIVDLKTHVLDIVPGSEGLFSPRWSPDGRYIAALSADSTKIMRFDFQTQAWRTWLTEPAGAVSYPIWASDSKSIYFDDLVTGEETVRKVRLGENHAEQVFKLEGVDRYPGPFGLWSGRTPDGAWMFVRDRSTQEVYKLTLELP
jgi:Tol biopolymer transport system component